MNSQQGGQSHCTSTNQSILRYDEWVRNQTKDASNKVGDAIYVGRDHGPTNEAISITDILKIFHLLLLEDFYDKVFLETNCYAQQQCELKHDTCVWNPISKEELMTFIGLNISMGLISLLESHDY